MSVPSGKVIAVVPKVKPEFVKSPKPVEEFEIAANIVETVLGEVPKKANIASLVLESPPALLTVILPIDGVIVALTLLIEIIVPGGIVVVPEDHVKSPSSVPKLVPFHSESQKMIVELTGISLKVTNAISSSPSALKPTKAMSPAEVSCACTK
jgi:hypothetical protein